MKNWKELNSTK